MTRHELLQGSPKEIVKSQMEAVLEKEEQAGAGNLCDFDAVHALDILRGQGFYTRASRDKIIRLEGPLFYYNHKKGKVVRADHHTVGQINEDWVVDLACKPGHRVYFNFEDYQENSGIELPENK